MKTIHRYGKPIPFEEFPVNKSGDNFAENLRLSTRPGLFAKLFAWVRHQNTRLYTPFKVMQVRDQKRENRAIHREAGSLSTTTSLN